MYSLIMMSVSITRKHNGCETPVRQCMTDKFGENNISSPIIIILHFALVLGCFCTTIKI